MSDMRPATDLQAALQAELEATHNAEQFWQSYRESFSRRDAQADAHGPTPPFAAEEPTALPPGSNPEAMQIIDDIQERIAAAPRLRGGGGMIMFDPDWVAMTLQRRMRFLHELQDQLTEDPATLRFVDSLITNRIHEMETQQRTALANALTEQAQKYEAMLAAQKREAARATHEQNRFSVVVTVISSSLSLMAGWLISAISPLPLLHVFPK